VRRGERSCGRFIRQPHFECFGSKSRAERAPSARRPEARSQPSARKSRAPDHCGQYAPSPCILLRSLEALWATRYALHGVSLARQFRHLNDGILRRKRILGPKRKCCGKPGDRIAPCALRDVRLESAMRRITPTIVGLAVPLAVARQDYAEGSEICIHIAEL
jgi:hypothetical protein